MALFAAGLPISALGVVAKDLWTAVAFISIATACHQAWSANMFTVASDAFPSRAVGSVVGFGGMCGGIGGMLMLLVAGGMLQWLGSFTPLFIFAGVMHPLAWIAIRALVGRNIAQIDLDKGLRTAQSPALFALGLGSWPWAPRSPRSFSQTGATSVGDEKLRRRCRRWRCRREPARPDGPCAGLREPRSPARCRPFGGVIARAGTRRCEGKRSPRRI